MRIYTNNANAVFVLFVWVRIVCVGLDISTFFIPLCDSYYFPQTRQKCQTPSPLEDCETNAFPYYTLCDAYHLMNIVYDKTMVSVNANLSKVRGQIYEKRSRSVSHRCS